MATLAEKQAELVEAKAALAAARLAQSYGQGDRSLQRAALISLESHVARIHRDIDALQAASLGARNPTVSTASYR